MKVRSAIDRARRDLSGTIIGFVGTCIEVNPFQKYSNLDLRYLTSSEFAFRTVSPIHSPSFKYFNNLYRQRGGGVTLNQERVKKNFLETTRERKGAD
jgi:hypothetical protein